VRCWLPKAFAGLAAVLVGSVAASEIYVRSKVQACAELASTATLYTAGAVTTEEMRNWWPA